MDSLNGLPLGRSFGFASRMTAEGFKKRVFMKGEKVEISLHTPILIEAHYEGGGVSKGEAVTRILAQVSEVLEAGLFLEVQKMFTERSHNVEPPHSQLFLPFHKIDHLFVL